MSVLAGEPQALWAQRNPRAGDTDWGVVGSVLPMDHEIGHVRRWAATVLVGKPEDAMDEGATILSPSCE